MAREALASIGCESDLAAAHFLWSRQRSIKRSKIGEILSASGNEGLLAAFVANFELGGKTIVQALRLGLETLAPPNSSSMVADLLEALGLEFAQQNCELSWTEISPRPRSGSRRRHTGSTRGEEWANVSTLILALCMLNTDLHKTVIKEKMTCSKFIESVHGMEHCSGIPDSVISTAFDDIQQQRLGELAYEPSQVATERLPSHQFGVWDMLHAFRRQIFA